MSSTEPANSAPAPSTEPANSAPAPFCLLTSLPPEIRLQIYQYLLLGAIWVSRGFDCHCRHCIGNPPRCELCIFDEQRRARCAPSILRTSKFIYNDLQPLFNTMPVIVNASGHHSPREGILTGKAALPLHVSNRMSEIYVQSDDGYWYYFMRRVFRWFDFGAYPNLRNVWMHRLEEVLACPLGDQALESTIKAALRQDAPPSVLRIPVNRYAFSHETEVTQILDTINEFNIALKFTYAMTYHINPRPPVRFLELPIAKGDFNVTLTWDKDNFTIEGIPDIRDHWWWTESPLGEGRNMFRFDDALSAARVGNDASADQPHLAEEAEDRVAPLTAPGVAGSQEVNPVQSIPPWIRELDNSRAARHSRASSIVSTRTKFSTFTLQEDARSIDLELGGQYFRINRDGSRITADDPPPYTGPAATSRFRNELAAGDPSVNQLEGDDEDHEGSGPEDGTVTPRSSFTAIHVDSAVAAAHAAEVPELAARRLSFEAGDDFISITTQAEHRATPVLPGDSTPTTQPTLNSPSIRRGTRKRLRALITSTETPNVVNLPRRHQSAGPVLSKGSGSRATRSPNYIGRNANGIFPPLTRPVTSWTASLPGLDSGSMDPLGGRDDERPFEDSQTPLSMDTENDISLHYARMMRKLDYDHRKALHLKDKELAESRERLHEKDTVLRQQLRAKDFLIDDLRTRLGNLEENVEAMLERARHEVEDLWESRWKDRDFHLRERMQRMEEAAKGRLIEGESDPRQPSTDEPTSPTSLVEDGFG